MLLTETKMKSKRMATASYNNCYSYGGDEDQEDRLSALPDVLLIYIFSFIDIRLAVQSSLLSKRWVNLWTLLPVLNFDSSSFEEEPIYYNNDSDFGDKITFENFIDKVLTCRNGTIKIDGVSIKVTNYKTMARVFSFALRHHVPNLSIDTSEYLTQYRTFSCSKSSDSLSSFTLKGMLEFGIFPKFSGLVSLRLERVKIVESDAFSCFPNLKELFLVNCKLPIDLHDIHVIAPQLSRLTIFSCFYHPIPYERIVLFTPKLTLLELDGLVPMSFEASKLTDLETVHIDCCFAFPRVCDRNPHQLDEDQQKVNLIKILWSVRNAKYVHLSPSTVKLLSLSHNKLDQEPCPFVNLKVLNLIPPPNKPAPELHSSVAAYLLKGSPGVIVKALPR